MTSITSEQIATVKQRFGIIGTSELLDRALEVALRVAPTDLTVLVTGESGVGKEFFPQVIHANSARKHNKYIAVNCAAIPEGTIDSELFGHEKGAFTGAVDSRKGYFEEADGGTIFLDEVAELPLPTQARLLRVLQSGEFIRVGSSKVQKTNVRVVAATNTDLPQAIASGRFREDLFYRLGTVPITVPALRERPNDIPLLFRKFASEVATQYRMPAVVLDDRAREVLMNYYWRGNIRQLKNVAEQISAIEQVRTITPEILSRYLPRQEGGAPMAAQHPRMEGPEMTTERELLYKVLFDMRSDINDLKRMLTDLMQGARMYREQPHEIKGMLPSAATPMPVPQGSAGSGFGYDAARPAREGAAAHGCDAETPVYTESEEVIDEPPREKTKADVQREQILRALRRNNGRRRETAAELFMSERTLYRKLKELGIEND